MYFFRGQGAREGAGGAGGEIGGDPGGGRHPHAAAEAEGDGKWVLMMYKYIHTHTYLTPTYSCIYIRQWKNQTAGGGAAAEADGARRARGLRRGQPQGTRGGTYM